MFFNICLTVSLIIFLGGLIYRLVAWHRYRIGGEGPALAPGQRLSASINGVARAVFSARIGRLLGSFLLDGILQRRILKKDFLRWLAHILIYGGFMLLLLFHALDKYITANLFPYEAATAAPWLFLRNLFGVLVLVGVVLAIIRRLTARKVKLTTNAMDVYAIILMLVIMLSGFVLEGMKIVSEAKFDEMVENFSGHEGDDDLNGLKEIWAQEYGVVFAEKWDEVDEEAKELARENHESSCLACHANPRTAFLSWSLSRIFKPLAVGISQSRAFDVLWYIHWLACFIGLAYLPFSKMLHIITGPLSLMANAVMDKDKSDPANWATKQVMELSACTHCAACSTHCSVGVHFSLNPNRAILPSEKLAALNKLVTGAGLHTSEMTALAEGQETCTACFRCTTVCPVGINLQEMWFSLKEELAKRHQPGVFASLREETHRSAQASRSAEVVSPAVIQLSAGLGLAGRSESFSECYSCQTCTNVCPVVAQYEEPKEKLDLLPHQIMYSLGLGLKEEALGAAMVWNCLTCYHCQEACPQGVRVADVLYELRNLSAGQSRTGRA